MSGTKRSMTSRVWLKKYTNTPGASVWFCREVEIHRADRRAAHFIMLATHRRTQRDV